MRSHILRQINATKEFSNPSDIYATEQTIALFLRVQTRWSILSIIHSLSVHNELKVYAILHKTERNEDMVEKLTGTQIETLLRNVDGWAKVKDREAIYKHFQFPDFVSAFSWMTRVAMVAEKMDHHPEWSNVYNKVEVNLITHSEGGITKLDIDLAQKIDTINNSIKS